jgi:lipopolysaccharide/colanic/teichoic acid biosynthesis glycosyltransferase
MGKRVFDVVASLVGLLVLSPIFFGVALLIKLDSKGPIFFRQERMGRNLRPFRIYKFRTMFRNAPLLGGTLTAGRDSRITKVGLFLRKTKIDELPQLFNVLRGDMSLVGPRPEVPRYVDLFRTDYENILSIRPGITDLASLKYRDEQMILGFAADPEREYVERVLPDKIALAKEYIRKSSFLFDVSVLLKTVLEIIKPRDSASSVRAAKAKD